MANRNRNRNQSQPQSQPEEILAAVQDMPVDEGNGHVIPMRRKANAKNAALIRNERVSKAYEQKAQLVGAARQKLAEAADMAAQGGEAETQATQTASEAAGMLYQGRIEGVITDDEITNYLGDAFGYREKGNASNRVDPGHRDASKTPFGLGEVIRKRLVRSVKATDFVRSNGEEVPTAFFEPLDVSDVAPLINELRDGKRTIWSVYNELGELKKKAGGTSNRVAPAFDPARIAAMANTLGNDYEASVTTIAENDDLFNAWADLFGIIDVVLSDERLVEKVEAA